MIIFDLDGTLANCDHRKHFVDPRFHPDFYIDGKLALNPDGKCCDPSGNPFKPHWKAFFEACDKDKPILPVINFMLRADLSYEIWSGRCESVRKKTEDWICQFMHRSEMPNIRMRPIGNSTPDQMLKERWLDEAFVDGKKIDFVIDDRPKVVRMWRRRGIFVFDVNQSGEEF